MRYYNYNFKEMPIKMILLTIGRDHFIRLVRIIIPMKVIIDLYTQLYNGIIIVVIFSVLA